MSRIYITRNGPTVKFAMMSGNYITYLNQPKSRWEIWFERVKTFRWCVPKTKDVTYVLTDTAEST